MVRKLKLYESDNTIMSYDDYLNGGRGAYPENFVKNDMFEKLYNICAKYDYQLKEAHIARYGIVIYIKAIDKQPEIKYTDGSFKVRWYSAKDFCNSDDVNNYIKLLQKADSCINELNKLSDRLGELEEED